MTLQSVKVSVSPGFNPAVLATLKEFALMRMTVLFELVKLDVSGRKTGY